MKRTAWCAAVCVAIGALSGNASGQSVAVPRGPAGLAATARVLIIGARPGDEDNALSAWLMRGHHIQTAFLSLTRGESAPNANGPETQLLLGMVRTAELLVERQEDGGFQYFTRAYDFGTPSADSTVYARWPRDSVLEDVVTVIRAFRPQVIISLATADSTEPDAERRVTAEMAAAAFRLAVDTVGMPPARTSLLGAWQPRMLFTEVDSATANDLAIDVGQVDAVSGRTYAELGADQRQAQRTAPLPLAPPVGQALRYLRLTGQHAAGGLANAGPVASLFAGVDTTWARFDTLSLRFNGQTLLDSFHRAVTDLDATARGQLDSSSVHELEDVVRWATRIRGTLQCVGRAARGCDGSWGDLALSLDGVQARATAMLVREHRLIVDATADREAVAVGDSVGVTVRVYNGGQSPVRIATVGFTGAIGIGAAPWTSLPINAGATTVFRGFFHVNRMSLAWWALHDVVRGTEIYDAPTDTGHPVNDRLLAAGGVDDWPGVARVRLWLTDSTRISVAVPIVFRDSTQLRGDNRQPVAGVPEMSILLDRGREYVRANIPVDRIVRATVSTAQGAADTVHVVIHLPTGVTTDSTNRRVALEPFGSKTLVYRLRGTFAPGGHEVAANVIVQQLIKGPKPGDPALLRRFSTNWGIVRLSYPHIPTQWFSEFAKDSVQAVSLNLPMGMHVGIVGGGQKSEMREKLVELGVPADALDPSLLGAGSLTGFTALLLDPQTPVDAANIRDNSAAIGRFAAAGGTVVVLGRGASVLEMGVLPYPVKFHGGDSTAVPDPTIPVQLLASGVARLGGPNKVTEADFAAWTGARADALPSRYDPRYWPVVSMSNARGVGTEAAILVATQGRGRIIYTGLTLGRQVVAATNPGAAHLLVSLLTSKPQR